MKRIYFIPVILLAVLLVTGTGCNREDPAALAKERLIRKVVSDISTDSIADFVSWLQEMDTRFALAANNRQVANAIKEKFISMGYTDTQLDSFNITKLYNGTNYEKTEYNVIATLEGSSASDSVSIIGAHYDDITSGGNPFDLAPGANDNASGVAVALETARVIRKNSFTPNETIKFIAFGAEEQGLIGSSDYVKKAYARGEKIRFMLNNDMVAYENDPDKSHWRVNILDYPNSLYLRSEAEGICGKFSVLQPYTDDKYSHASDSYSFCLQGYKSIFFFANNIDPNYHSTNDVAVNCNFDYCAEIVKVNSAILLTKN